jgi:hypothetical protein
MFLTPKILYCVVLAVLAILGGVAFLPKAQRPADQLLTTPTTAEQPVAVGGMGSSFKDHR